MGGTRNLRNSTKREMQSSSGYKHFKEITSHVCCWFVFSLRKLLIYDAHICSHSQVAEAQPLRPSPRCQYYAARAHQEGAACYVSMVICYLPGHLPLSRS